MPHRYRPSVGNWYKDIEYNTIFEVVAKDEDEGSVEIQYYDGEIEELDLDLWYQLDLKYIAEPDDWSGPYELSKEDHPSDDEAIHPEDWSPLGDIEPEDNY